MTTVDVEVPLEYRRFSVDDYRRWCSGDRIGLPETPRLVFRRRSKQPHYHFAETLHACELMADGFICWSGFYKLFSIPKQGHARTANSLEIRAALRQSNLPDPVLLRSLLPHVLKWPQPDVVAYHPKKGWKFHEIKFRRDRVRPEQLGTLALLRHFYGAEVAVVNYVERLPARPTAPPHVVHVQLPTSMADLATPSDIGEFPRTTKWSLETLRAHGWQGPIA